MSEFIVWKEPPPKEQYSRQGPMPLWEVLRAHPGEWCLYAEGATSATTVTQIKAGNRKGIEQGEFDATSRKTPEGKFDIYVRYVGREVPAEERVR